MQYNATLRIKRVLYVFLFNSLSYWSHAVTKHKHIKLVHLYNLKLVHLHNLYICIISNWFSYKIKGHYLFL